MFLGIDFSKFISWRFWLESNPGELSTRFDIIFLVILIIGYGLFAAARVYQSKLLKNGEKIYANFWQRTAKMFFNMAVLFTFIFFFRYEGVPYLGGRYLFLAWSIGGIIWLARLTHYYYKSIPQLLIQRQQRLEKLKYV